MEWMLLRSFIVLAGESFSHFCRMPSLRASTGQPWALEVLVSSQTRLATRQNELITLYSMSHFEASEVTVIVPAPFFRSNSHFFNGYIEHASFETVVVEFCRFVACDRQRAELVGRADRPVVIWWRDLDSELVDAQTELRGDGYEVTWLIGVVLRRHYCSIGLAGNVGFVRIITKHHVDYLASFLKAYGYAVSYVYGSLDQTARKMQVQDFRSGITNILVVTDAAARGLDVPLLANVINYDFPSQPKIFVHRVGRTARAGKEGWSYSLITQQDMPYLLDLQLFLSRKLILGRAEKESGIFQNAIVAGNMRRDHLERYMEDSSKLIEEDIDLYSMRDVAAKGEKQYMRSRNAASAESVKRSKQLARSDGSAQTNILFEDIDQEAANVEQQRLD